MVASFIADLYFIDGLTNYPLESFVLILALMVPWRVIRVLNSEYTGNPLTGTLANSKDPDEMQQDAAFHQCLCIVCYD